MCRVPTSGQSDNRYRCNFVFTVLERLYCLKNGHRGRRRLETFLVLVAELYCALLLCIALCQRELEGFGRGLSAGAAV